MSKFSALKRFFLSISLILSMSCFVGTASARWAAVDDTDVAIDVYNHQLEIHKDGTSTETIELVMHALKESGKDALVSYPLVYNSMNSTLKVLEAKTLVNDKQYPVDIKHIEDKPLASSPKGFDQNNQLLIAFPNMAKNAKAYLKYKITVTEPAVKGFFSTQFKYGAGQYYKNSKVQVVSELPLNIHVQDSESFLEVKQGESNKKHTLEINLKKPVLKMAVEESNPAADYKIYPCVTLSTLKEWPQLGKLMADRYEAVVSQKLPPLFEEIAKEASTKSSTIEKINTVTSRLSENVTYMGDWRTVKGAFVPRSLSEIYNSKIGDCKDFSASTVAILRKLGMKAHISLVFRGNGIIEQLKELPNIFEFNHAIVSVQDKEKTFWIDPTNFSSYAQGIYPDIAQRMTFVMDPDNPILSNTTPLKSDGSVVKLFQKIILPDDKSHTAVVEGKLSLKGTAALPLIGADLQTSKETISHAIISGIADISRTIDWKVKDYNLSSRVAHDVNFEFNFTEKNNQMKTTAGEGYLLNTPTRISQFLTKTKDRVTDISLDMPGTYEYETVLSKAVLVGNKTLTCSIDSPWLKASRDIKNTPEGIKVVQTVEIIKSKILRSEYNSPEFSQFQDKVYNCFGDTTLIYKK